jgi:hypothetical protein
MQFNDVRGMMKLPLPNCGITGGCNFAAALALCNLVAGMAVVLYNRPPGSPGTGDGFVALLLQFYPWDPRERPCRKAEALYQLVRNPLAHSLGVARTPAQRSYRVRIVKRPLTEATLGILEANPSRPKDLPLAVTVRRSMVTINVPGLYWGVAQLFRRLTADTGRMTQAERRIPDMLRRA